MMNKRTCLTIVLMGAMMSLVTTESKAQGVTAVWNSNNVLLPSSQYTPSQRWSAQVMVFNTGESYTESNYNKVWGTPPDDSNGRKWYEKDYSLTNGEKTWQQQQAPFSSDESYKGYQSYRWITLNIMGEIYFRRTFTFSKPIEGSVFLACGHDDAPSEFYINGVQVHTVADGWNNDEYVLLTDEQKALIKTDGSENVIAVHVHQNWGGAYADCGLYEADMIQFLLPLLDAGPWPCFYYFLNSNDELNGLSPSQWAGRCVNEDDWAWGNGPLSNSNDRFLTTFWGSGRMPLLVRRHFTLTEDEINQLANCSLQLLCSYDENPKVYLNGTLIWSASGWNDNDYAQYTLSNANKQLLKEGDNVLAVSLQQGAGGGHIDYGLSVNGSFQPTDISSPASSHPVTEGRPVIYNLKGQLVGYDTKMLRKGIYIMNGKKIVIK